MRIKGRDIKLYQKYNIYSNIIVAVKKWLSSGEKMVK
jgi:hypothetical protein